MKQKTRSEKRAYSKAKNRQLRQQQYGPKGQPGKVKVTRITEDET